MTMQSATSTRTVVRPSMPAFPIDVAASAVQR
jgi:hypothetical protein